VGTRCVRLHCGAARAARPEKQTRLPAAAKTDRFVLIIFLSATKKSFEQSGASGRADRFCAEFPAIPCGAK